MADIDALLKTPGSLSVGGRSPSPIILSTRLRLARNLSEVPFPGWSKAGDRQHVLSNFTQAAQTLDMLKDAYCFEMTGLSTLQKQLLVERHLISRDFIEAKEGSAVFISKDASCSVMVNEEDHLRIQVLMGGLNLKKSWKVIDEVDTDLEKDLNYAFSTELGYLTACPTNIGTAMRASAMLHLPGLVLSGQMEKVIRAVNQLGIAVRGLFGEGSDATGSIFQISNQQTLGQSEAEIMQKLTSVLQTVIEQEENARTNLLVSDGRKFLDKLGRAIGTLKNSFLLSAAEAMNLLSLIRLAIDLNLYEGLTRLQLDRLFMDIQPAHFEWMHNSKDGFSEAHRADYLRRYFMKLGELTFDRLDGIDFHFL